MTSTTDFASLDPSIIPTKRVRVGTNGDGEATYVQLRGLSANDFFVLFQQDESAMAVLLEDMLEVEDGKEAMENAIRSLPLISALAIALAADQVDNADLIAKLPIAKQLEMLVAVLELTFPDEDSKKNFKENAAQLIAMFGFQSFVTSNSEKD